MLLNAPVQIGEIKSRCSLKAILSSCYPIDYLENILNIVSQSIVMKKEDRPVAMYEDEIVLKHSKNMCV